MCVCVCLCAQRVKGIVSTIQLAKLNLQPVVDAQNPLLITVPLPPPTKELRDTNSKKANTVGYRALEVLKEARLTTHKRFMAARRSVRPDDFKKADKKMEGLVKKRKAEMEAIIAAARKKIEQD